MQTHNMYNIVNQVHQFLRSESKIIKMEPILYKRRYYNIYHKRIKNIVNLH